MESKRFVLRMLPFLSLTSLSSGCGLILGLDQFTEGAASSTSTGSSSASTGGAGGMGTGGGTSGTGGSTCVAGTVEACYGGPVPTRAVGACKDGKHTCNADGSGWGACVGEVLPAAEDPSTKADENCDGFAGGDTVWAKRFGDDTFQVATSVAVDEAGNIYVTGYFKGTMQFGATVLSAMGAQDIFVAKFDPSGATLWATRFGGAGTARPQSIVIDSTGNIILTGVGSSSLKFGGGDVGAGIFVAKLDSSAGHIWSKSCGGSAGIYKLYPKAVVDKNGDVLLAGNFDGTANCGSGSYKAAGSDDILLAKLSGADGAGLWSRQFGTASSEAASGVAVDSIGNVLITGVFDQMISLDFGNLVNAGGHDIFAAKFDSNGNSIWSYSWGDATDQTVSDVAVDSLDGPVMAGSLGASAFGLVSTGYSDAFAARLTSTGTLSWGKNIGGTTSMSQAYASGVAVDANDGAVVGGSFIGNVKFGSDTFTNTSLYNAYIARLDKQGALLWGKAFADADVTASDEVRDVAFGPNSEIIMVGRVGGPVDFGTGPLAGTHGIFVAKLAP